MKGMAHDASFVFPGAWLKVIELPNVMGLGGPEWRTIFRDAPFPAGQLTWIRARMEEHSE